MKRLFIPLVILLLCTAFIVGCSGNTATTTAPAPTKPAAPATTAAPPPATSAPAPALTQAPTQAPATAPSPAQSPAAQAGQPVYGGILRQITGAVEGSRLLPGYVGG